MSQPNLKYGFEWEGKGVIELKAWLRRLINHRSNRYVEHPSFVFHAGNLIQRKISKSVSTQYVKKYIGEDDPTVSELLEMSEHDKKKFCQSVHSWTSQIQGTDAYWGDVRRHCEACIRHNIIRGRGLPSFFITSSCAEFHHPALSRLVAEAVACEKLHVASQQDSQDQNLFEGRTWEDVSVDEYTRMNTDDKYRRRMILNHPQITVKFFELRTRQYIAAVLQPAWGIRDYFFRFEFAEGRGQVFCTFVEFFFVPLPLSTSLFPPSFSLSLSFLSISPSLSLIHRAIDAILLSNSHTC